MSTTTEPSVAVTRRDAPLGARRFCAIAAGVLCMWFTAVLVGTALLEPTRDVLVIASGGPVGRLPETAPVDLVDAPGGFLRVRGAAPGFVRALYAGGAWLVLPARAGGCVGPARMPVVASAGGS